MADGFRNYVARAYESPQAELLVDKAQLLTPDRAGNDGADRRPARAGRQRRRREARRVHQRPGTLTNDFFVNLLDMGTAWKRSAADANVLEGRDRKTGALKWTGTVVGPGVRLELAAARAGRGLCRSDAQAKFVQDFVAAWTKVMNLDRFDLK